MKNERLQDLYEMSPMQEGMLFHSLIDDRANPYFEQNIFTIEGKIDGRLLEESFNLLIERYDILRTIFRYENLKRPLQIVLRKRRLKMYFEDISQLGKEEKEIYLEEFKRKDRKEKFDLAKDLLMRVSLLRTGTDAYLLVWSSHHIVMDGWCLGIIFKDLIQIYRSLKEGKPPDLGPVTPYKKYINWLKKQDKAAGLRYWREYLDGCDRPTGLPVTGEPGAGGNDEPEEYNLIIERELARGLEDIAGENQVTVNSVFQTLWGILLQGYNHTADVVFGAVVSGRPPEIDGIEDMVGLFVNTVPVRIRTGDIELFSQLLRHVQRQAVTAKSYEYLPLADIQENSSLKNRLIDHLVGFQNYPIQEEVKSVSSGTGLGFVVGGMEYKERTHYNLNCLIGAGEEYLVKFNFNARAYDNEFIETAAQRLKKLVGQVVKNHDIPLKDIEIILEEEKARVLYEFNDTGAPYPHDRTIHRLFEETAARHPQRIAVSFPGKGNRHLTYDKLNNMSGQLALLLRLNGLQPGTAGAIKIERSIEMVIGLLGILKAGAAYLPIDPGYPEDRRQYMLADSGTNILLTLSDFSSRPSRPSRFPPAPQALLNLSEGRCFDSPAYIIYTSGSTGRPKGVMIEHRSVVRLVKNQNFIEFTSGDRLLLTGAVVFDITTFEIWAPLLNGFTLFIAHQDDILDAGKLGEILCKSDITILHLVPQLLDRLAEQAPGLECFANLKYFLVGGDVVRPHVINQLRKKHKNLNILHMYGPTENTTFSTFFHVDKDYGAGIPIGKPVANSTVYIVNKSMNLTPPGIAGELAVGGEGVARGYLNNPALTSEKFCLRRPGGSFRENRPLDPRKSFCLVSQKFFGGSRGAIFQKSPPGYKTGDLSRWLVDGNIEFLGREDQQVKVRGMRIEPGEIEQRLVSHQKIKAAVVLAREDGTGEKYLCAYFVVERKAQSARCEGAELREYLSQTLPDYMVPAYFVPLENIPLTVNGKIHRQALPGPEIEAKDRYAPPRDEIEQRMVKIWSEVLGLASESIGIDSDFFQLGGHSLKAMTLISKMHQALDIKVPLAEIFKRPTIRGLAGFIGGSGAAADKYIAVQPAEKKSYYPLSSLQERLFILSRIEGAETAYNLPQVMTVEGTLQIDRMEKTFRLLIQRHENLRTSFIMIKNEPLQRIHEHVEFEIERFDLAAKNAKGHEEMPGFVRPFDLSQAPLLRVGLGKMTGDRHLLFFDMHHIVSDGTSTGILVREVIELYHDRDMPPLRLQYRDFALWQHSGKGRDVMAEQEEYWLECFKKPLPQAAIYTDYPRPPLQSFAGATLPFRLEKEIKEKIQQLNRDTGTTLYIVLLAVLNILLARYTGQEDIVIGTPIAGRQHRDFDHIIGLFINPLAMRNFPAGDKTFAQFLAEVKKNTFRAFRSQEYPFGRLIEKLGLKKDLSRNGLFDVELAVQNMESSELQIQGLQFRPYEHFKSDVTQVDIALYAAETPGAVVGSLVYCTALFKQETMERFVVYFKEILSRVLDDGDLLIKDIAIAHDFSEVESEAYRKESLDFDF